MSHGDMHYRQRIRRAAATALLNATDAGTNVFTSRARPVLEILQRGEAVLSVYTGDETSQRAGDGINLERTLTVTIEGMAGGGDDIDDKLDGIIEQVEAALDADPRLSGLLSDDLVLTGTSMEISARGNQQVGAFRLDFDCQYLTPLVSANYLPGDLPGDDIVVPPVPSEVNTRPLSTAAAYVAPLGPANTGAPLWGDDGNPVTPPNETLNRDATIPAAKPPADTACGPDGCDIPAWRGDGE